MAEHLHGYPQCSGPTGQPCAPTDLNYAECQSRGALVSCTQSVVDGIPTGQYNCAHRDAAARPAKKAKAKAKPKKAAKKAKKAAKKPAKKSKGTSKGKSKSKGKGKKKGGGKKKK
jgi:sRNA-binding protein